MLTLRVSELRIPAKFTLWLLAFILFTACGSDDGVREESVAALEPSLAKLPRIEINTLSRVEIPDEPKIDASIRVIEDDAISYEGKIAIEIRGSSSQLFPKKGYGFETRDASNIDLDVSLLGFPEEEDWVLHGPYSDKTLIRNVLIYDLAREMNQYASRTKFVALHINEQSNGVYVFMEKLKRDKARIDINKLKADENEGEDLTGGYILKIDKSDQEGYTDQNSFSSEFGASLDRTGNPINFLFEYPKVSDITSQQRTYISTYIGDFEAALASDDFADPVRGYAAYVDIDSFVDFFICNELSNNVDGYRISTYMHKDKNEKLKMGPIWDFNIAFGNANYCGGDATDVWAYKFNDRCPDDDLSVPFWWGRLLEDPVFVDRLKGRWSVLRSSILTNTAMLNKVDEYRTLLSDSGAVQSNFNTWPTFGIYIWPNAFVGDNYAEEIDYLKNWISDRTIWLDNSINAL